MTVTGGQTSIAGTSSEGVDTISVKNSALGVIENYGEISIYGGTGGGNSSIQNVTVGSSASLKYYGDGANTITADGVTVRSGYISLGSGGTNAADKISLKNLSQEEQGGSVQIIGNGGNDSISAENVTLSGANASIIGGSDALNIAVDNVSMYRGYFLVSNSSVQSAGADTISVSNVTVQGYSTSTTYLEVQAGGGADVVSLTSSAALSSSGLKAGGGGNDSIKINNVTSIAHSSIYFDGGSGTDSIYFGNSTVLGGDFYIYGGAGKDSISLENINDTGYDFTRFNIYGDHRYTNSVASADVYSVKNVTMPSGEMYIYGTDSVNDTVSVDGLKLGGAYTNRYGDQDAGSGYIQISMRGGNDSVSVSNIEMLKGSSQVKISGGEGADNISVANVSVTGSDSKVYIEGNDGADKISVTDSNNVQITSGDGKDTLYLGGDVQGTISDYVAADDIISLSGNYDKAYYKDGVFIYGTGVKVSLGGVSDVSSIGSGVIYNGSKKTNFNDFVTVLEWKLENGVASYGDLITISGLSSLASFSDLTIDGKAINTLDDEGIKELGGEIIIAKNALDSLQTVEVTSGFTLALGRDVTNVPKDVPEHWEISEGNAAYFSTGQSAGYVAYENQIYYSSEYKGGVITEVNGLSEDATISDISLKNKTVTIKNHGLDASKTVTNTNSEYILALGADVTNVPKNISNYWSVSGGVADYLVDGTTAGFVTDGASIYMQTAFPGTSEIKISGLSSVSAEEDLSLNKTTVTVSQNALDSSKTVEISDGYTLVLGKDVEAAVTTPEGWQILKGTAEYKTENVTAGYNVEDNKIVYTDGQIAETVVSVGGLKSSATEKQIKLDESYKKVSLAAAAVQGTVTISADYALEMGSGSYSKTSIQGGDGDDTIYSAGNKLEIYGNGGKDFISLKSGTSGNSISGGAGDDTIISEKGKNIYQYAEGDGNDTWQGFTANDSIQITSGEITSWNVEDNDLTFNVGDGAITIKDGAGIKINTAIGKNKNTVQIYTAEGILNDKQTAITLGAEVKSYIVPTKPAIVSIDGSATNGVEISGGTKAEKIYGGAGDDIINGDKGNDSIYGNAGNDSINGGEGNDKLFGDEGDDTLSGGAGNDTFTGGDGADVFVYSAGNDVIADYETEDKISLASGEISSVGVSGKDVTLKIGKGSIKLKNSVGIKVNVNDEVFIYEKGVTYNEEKTVATLTATVKAESLTSAITVDGSALSTALKLSANDASNLINGGKGADSILGNGGDDTIYGNNGADKIWGGDGNDYIDGGAGNDSIFGGAGENTLTGGDGNDVFIYEGGNDLITDYTAGKDKIKIDDEFTAAVNGQDVIFTTEKGKITVEGGAGVEITTLDSKNKATKQKYTSASAQTLDLLYDDNFVTDDFGIDDITAPKFEVQNIETQNNFELSQPVITYSEDK